MKRIGLLGGTFNPVHLGHLVLAEEVRDRLRLDEVWFIPVAEPPLKSDPDLAPAADRLRMVEMAIASQPAFRALDIEIRRGGKSYTIDTLRALDEEYRHTEWHFIVGSDAAAQMPSWKDVPALQQLCEFVVVARPGHPMPALPRGGRRLEMPLLDISASDIRRRVAQGHTVRFLVPDAVRDYIATHKLYLITSAAGRS